MRIHSFGKVLAVLLFCSAVSSPACAHDLTPPPWRGQANTTFQQWDFLTQPTIGEPIAPEPGWFNPYGTPYATVATSVWHSGDAYPGYHGLTWINTGWPITFTIPNYNAPNPVKYIWVQVTYLRIVCTGLALDVRTLPTAFTALPSETQGLSQNFVHAVWKLELRPNPPEEQVFVVSLNGPAWVDQVVIDTQCVSNEEIIPEWSALALAAPALLGVLSLRRRRI